MHAACFTALPKFRDLPWVWKGIESGAVVWYALLWNGQITKHSTHKAAVAAFWS